MSYSFAQGVSEHKTEVVRKLYQQYKKLMFFVARDILHDDFLAEDAVQTAFSNLLHIRFKLDDINSNKTKSFVVIIVRNIAINQYNKLKKQAAASEGELFDVPDGGNLPIDIVISNENANDIYASLLELEPQYSDILRMKYFMGFSNKEISSVFDISEELVRVRLYRGRKKLFDMLKDQVNG